MNCHYNKLIKCAKICLFTCATLCYINIIHITSSVSFDINFINMIHHVLVLTYIARNLLLTICLFLLKMLSKLNLTRNCINSYQNHLFYIFFKSSKMYYLPVLVIIISVPMSLNLSQRSLVSSRHFIFGRLPVYGSGSVGGVLVPRALYSELESSVIILSKTNNTIYLLFFYHQYFIIIYIFSCLSFDYFLFKK